MGVKWLLRWRAKSDSDGSQGQASSAEDDLLTSIVEQLGCKPAREKGVKLEVKCHLLKQQQPQDKAQSGQGMKDVWLVQFSDASDTCFLLDRAHHTVIEADNGMLGLVEKKMEYRIKTCVTYTGKRYVKGDFSVRIASANSTAAGMVSLLGHVVELEYHPISCPTMAAGMLASFLELLKAHIPTTPSNMPIGSLDLFRDSLEKFTTLPRNFMHQHATVLYVDMTMMFLILSKNQQQQQQQQQQATNRIQASGTPKPSAMTPA